MNLMRTGCVCIDGGCGVVEVCEAQLLMHTRVKLLRAPNSVLWLPTTIPLSLTSTTRQVIFIGNSSLSLFFHSNHTIVIRCRILQTVMSAVLMNLLNSLFFTLTLTFTLTLIRIHVYIYIYTHTRSLLSFWE
jgi:hypothetical protein